MSNDFLPFAVAGGSNIISQADYAALPARLQGFVAGVALSAQLNKVWRQSSIISAMIGQYISDHSGADATDDGDIAALLDKLEIGLRKLDLNYRLAGGTANALSITLDPAPATWADLVNVPLFIRIAANNSDVATLAVSGVSGTRPIYMPGGKYPAPAGLLRSGSVVILMYNGASVEYLNAPAPAQASFFINQSTGNDGNVGTVGSPIASIFEALRRTPIGGLCNIGLVADYTHNQVTRLNGRRVNLQGRDAGTGTILTPRAFSYTANPIAAASQDSEFRGTDLYPSNTSCLILGVGDALQCNGIHFSRGIASGGTQVNSAQFIADGMASIDFVNSVLNSPASGVNTVWFASIISRLNLSFASVFVTGETTGKIYTTQLGGAPLAPGADPNSVWNFSSNVTSS